MNVQERLAHSHPQVVKDTHEYQERLTEMTDEALIHQLERFARMADKGADFLQAQCIREELLARMKEGTTLAYMHRGER